MGEGDVGRRGGGWWCVCVGGGGGGGKKTQKLRKAYSLHKLKRFPKERSVLWGNHITITKSSCRLWPRGSEASTGATAVTTSWVGARSRQAGSATNSKYRFTTSFLQPLP